MNITETQIETIKEKIENKFREAQADYMVFDINAEIDRSLTYQENLRILEEKTDSILNKSLNQLVKIQKAEELKIKEEQNNFIEEARKKHNMERDIFKDQNNFLILGKKGSGKTALGWSFASKINKESGRKFYVFNHPNPEILQSLPFLVNNITKLEHVYTLTDAVIIFDESQRIFSVLDKKVNNKFKNLLAISRQNNVCFIFICHNSYFINRSLFSFIDVKVIKEVNSGHWELERKHMQKLYEDIIIFGKENFYIDSDYVSGQQSFIKPEWFSEALSFSYRVNQNKQDFFR